jgi:SAGA-associated factor 73
MGAKRAVPGRSKPYNDLLLEWNRLNNPNFVEPVKRETKKEKKEKKDREREEKKKLMEQKKAMNATKKSGGKKGATIPAPIVETVDEVEEDVDSEVELDNMVRAVREAKNHGRIGVPMAVSEDVAMSSWFVVRREKVRCCRDQLYGALMGNRGGIASVPSMMRS